MAYTTGPDDECEVRIDDEPFTCYPEAEEDLPERMGRHWADDLTEKEIEESIALDWWYRP